MISAYYGTMAFMPSGVKGVSFLLGIAVQVERVENIGDRKYPKTAVGGVLNKRLARNSS
jgi:uncharacterized membrane protein YoaK (UPF0700 family)